MKALGRRMRRAIELAGLQHQEVARRMGMTAPGLSRCVNGKNDPMARTLAAFVRATKCDANWLLGVRRRS